MYDVFEPGKLDDKDQLFFINETTGCFNRQRKRCCPDCAAWSIDVMYTFNNANQKVMHLDRPSTCTCCCFNRPVVHVDGVGAGRLGSIADPYACWQKTFTVFDQNEMPL